jgi:mono/diheme cytochrome c family protein
MIRSSLALCALLACTGTMPGQPPPNGGGQQQTGFGGGEGIGGGGFGGGGFAGGFENDGGGCDVGVPFDSNPVVAPAKPPPAISGGTLAVMADGTLVAADSDRDVVWLVNGATVRKVMLTAGGEPGRVVEGPSGHALIALRRAGSVVDVDVAAGAVASTLAVCSAPRGLAYASSTLYVACAGGELVTVTGGAVQSSQHVADDLRDVVPVSDGLLLSTFRHAQVLHLGPTGQLVSLTNDDPFVPPDSFTEGPVDAGGFGDFDAGGPAGGIDAGPPVFDGPQFNRRIAWRMVPYAGGAFLTYQREQATQLLSFGGACTGGSYGAVFDQLPTLHTGLNAVVDGGLVEISSLNEHDMVLPVDVAVSQGGQVALVSAGTSQVDVWTIEGAFTRTRTPMPGRPTAVAFRGEDTVVFVREPAELEIISNGLTSHIPLSADSVASTGLDIFHQATNNQIACASCHPEAGDDSHVWQLFNGPRRTPSLRGGLSGTAPFHWSGDEATMPALLTDVLVNRMAGPMESPDRQQALLNWLDAQAVVPAPPQDPSAVARGQSTFLTLCASCHAGAQGTDNLTVDVGTGGMFQVPRLHELWYRAPFMHDGRAATLKDRFGPAGGTSHADVSALTQSQLDDLLAYLKAR